MNELRRTVPFLVLHDSPANYSVLLDRFEIGSRAFANEKDFYGKLAQSINLSSLGSVLSADEVIILVEEQYQVCLQYIYSHPLWEHIRSGNLCTGLYAYLIETRHYLAAAASRMTPSISAGIGIDPLTLLLSHHILEEYDHSKFFEEALSVLGCPLELVIASRPIPATIEWIHLTRAIAAQDGLMAAVCSGLMEVSALEHESVRGWHDMLAAKNLLPSGAVNAIFKHVTTDFDYGHAKNWQAAIIQETPISTRRACGALNLVTTVAEMIYRWLSCLEHGLSGDNVQAMPSFKLVGENIRQIDPAFNGLPVWPASILQLVSHGITESSRVRSVITTAYSFSGFVTGDSEVSDLTNYATALTSRLSTDGNGVISSEAIPEIISGWLRSIDGHELWIEMMERPSYALVYGYLLENYHYISSATRHISAAIAACSDPVIRLELLEHLEDEVDHGKILQIELEHNPSVLSVARCRPLATTVAFVGYLRDLGATDWKAYCIAIAFLQTSLTHCKSDNRNSLFYQTVINQLPEVSGLLGAIYKHDQIDDSLGHDEDAHRRLIALITRHEITKETLAKTALVPQLAWSFLDGILGHYQLGPCAIMQRVNWTCDYGAF